MFTDLDVQIKNEGFGITKYSIITNTDYVCKEVGIPRKDLIDKLSKYLAITKFAFEIDNNYNIKTKKFLIKPIDVRNAINDI